MPPLLFCHRNLIMSRKTDADLVPTPQMVNDTATNTVKLSADWVRRSFMLPVVRTELSARNQRFYTSAFYKYTDTSLGGNFALNPPPQYTPFADLPIRGRYSHTSRSGMGRRYSEAIDDNAQLIHMRFGVPQFSGLMRFFTTFYDPQLGRLSRTGRSGGFFYGIGKAIGFVVTLPLLPLILVGKTYNFLMQNPSSKYYYMKPTMMLYWQTVNTIANGVAVNMGIIPRPFGENATTEEAIVESNEAVENFSDSDIIEDKGEFGQFTRQDIEQFHNVLPNIFRKGGGVDVYSMASRTQRLANAARKKAEKAAISASENSNNNMYAIRQAIGAAASEQLAAPSPGFTGDADNPPGIDAYLYEWTKQDINKPKVDSVDGSSKHEGVLDNISQWTKDFVAFTSSELNDGGQWVTLRVNHTGESSESFSNSVGESSVQGYVNGASASSREFRFSFQDGKFLGDDNVLGKIVGTTIDSVTGLVEGLAETTGLQGLLAVFGNAYADIPKEWKDSTAELPKMSYRMELRSPYGNKMSRFQNLVIPLATILAAALPKSTGKHSYDMPYLVEVFDKGRAQSRLCMIDSLSITRGSGNIGWTRNHEPLGIDVDFSLVDLSSIMHAPINASPGFFDEDSAFNDYLAVLGSMSLTDQTYVGNKLRLNMGRALTDMKSWFSPARHAMWVADTLPGQAIRAFAKEQDRGQ